MTPADLAQHLAERVHPEGDPVKAVAGELVLYWMHHAARADENPTLDTAIAAAAALVVTEDFPAPPFPAWTRALARRTGAPIGQVDTACAPPLRLAERAFARAWIRRSLSGVTSAGSWPTLGGRLRVLPGDGTTLRVASPSSVLRLFTRTWSRPAPAGPLGPRPTVRRDSGWGARIVPH